MTGLAYLLPLAAASWLIRLGFIAIVPARRLPKRVTAALGHTAPAALAALVSVETVTGLSNDAGVVRLVAVASLLGIGLVAAWRANPALTALLGLGAALLVDLVLVR